MEDFERTTSSSNDPGDSYTLHYKRSYGGGISVMRISCWGGGGGLGVSV
jgi:hypothetical protein